MDEEPEIANAFQRDSIPTLILFQDGKAVRAAVGFRTKEQLIAMITE